MSGRVCLQKHKVWIEGPTSRGKELWNVGEGERVGSENARGRSESCVVGSTSSWSPVADATLRMVEEMLDRDPRDAIWPLEVASGPEDMKIS
jgi:hypothetical protein